MDVACAACNGLIERQHDVAVHRHGSGVVCGDEGGDRGRCGVRGLRRRYGDVRKSKKLHVTQLISAITVGRVVNHGQRTANTLGDRVAAAWSREFGRIRTGATIDGVVANTASEGVVAIPTIQGIVASTTVKLVGTAVAHNRVIAVAAQHVLNVAQRVLLNGCRLGRGVNPLSIVQGFALVQVNTYAHHGLVVLDPVHTGAAINRVRTASAIQAVVVRVPDDQVVEA